MFQEGQFFPKQPTQFVGGPNRMRNALSITNTANPAPTTGGSPSYASQSIGAAPTGSNRRFVFVSFGCFSAGATFVGGITIAGVSAPLTWANADGNVGCAWAAREVTTGTTATIAYLVAGTGTLYSCISVFSLICGPDGFSYASYNDDDRPLDFTGFFPAGSVGLGVAMNRDGGTHTWTGLTEVRDVDLNGSDYFSSAMASFPEDALAQAIQANSASAGADHTGIVLSLRR